MFGWQTSGRSCRMALEYSVPMARAMKKVSAYFIKRVFIRGMMKTPVREKALITVTLRKEKPHTGGLSGGEEGATLKCVVLSIHVVFKCNAIYLHQLY